MRMWRAKVIHKLRSNRGETLTETIVSVLVVSLVSAAFAVMIGTAGKLNAIAKKEDDDLLAAMNNMAPESIEANNSTVSVTVGGETLENFSVRLSKSENDNIEMYSYSYEADNVQ